MCERCGWKDLVTQVREVVKERHPDLGEGQQRWIETIALTADDDRHCSDHQKAVVRRILKERKIARWRLIPKALDRTQWTEAKKKRHIENKKMSRRLRQHGSF
jgi:hypothetical protein